MADDLPDAEDDDDRRLLSDIRCRGWAVVAIEESPHSPAYVFSAGLFHSFHHPEVLVLGLPASTSANIINAVGENVRGGGRFAAGCRSAQVLEGFEVAFLEIEPTNYRSYLGFALWLYRFRRFPALQCVWPDGSGRFPWEDGADEAVRGWQWLLGKLA